MNYNVMLIPLLLNILLIIILIITIKKKNKVLEKTVFEKHKLEILRKDELKDYFEEEWKKEEQCLRHKETQLKGEIAQKTFELNSQFDLDKARVDGKINELNSILKEKEKRYSEVNQDLDLYREGKIKEIDGTAAEYEKHKRLIVDQSIDKYRLDRLEVANQKMAITTEEIEKASEELKEILQTLEEERSKRAAVNEEILRQRKLEEEQDFYRIQINPEDKEDIEILRSITPRLRHPEAINKVIWTGYYQKPLAELRKRAGIEGSGVYKITRLKTNEIYIGQAVNVSTRWAEHCKAALGVGTLASSQLHRVMSADGCENFTFELLEEVPKDKLKERESYYIDFYDSKNYGLNTIRGEQK